MHVRISKLIAVLATIAVSSAVCVSLFADPNKPPPPDAWRRGPLRAVYSRFSMPLAGTIDGRECIETTGKLNSTRLCFAVADDYAFEIDETVELEVEFDTTVGNKVVVSYDSNHDVAGGEKPRWPTARLDKSSRWMRHTFKLERARFANRLRKNSDIMITSPGRRIRVSDIKIRRPNKPTQVEEKGRLILKVIDGSTGRPTPARVGLYDAGGHFQYPNENAVPINVFCRTLRMYNCRNDKTWPVKNTYAFYTNGKYECELTTGRYELVVRKGIEYRMVHGWVRIQPGKTLEHTVTLKHWRDMSAEGWYSGDTHAHIGRTREQNQAVMAQIQAEDLNVANCAQVGNVADVFFHQYAFGEEGKFRKGDYILLSSEEDPRTNNIGHTLFIDLKSMVRDDRTYNLYYKAFQQVKVQGGLIGYAHAGISFNASRGLALDVPFNLVDFIEILQTSRCRPEIWYIFLNLGYKIIPSAGSDYPYIDPPGAMRSYVRIDGQFSARAWFDNFAAARSFVTNGPMLNFTVNGKEMGSELQLAKGDQINIEAAAAVNPDIDKLDELKLIVHGRTIKKVKADGNNKVLQLSHTLTADQSMWLAVQARGVKSAVAHSAPVYVIVDGQNFWKTSDVPKLVETQRKHLKELLTKPISRKQGEIWTYETSVKKWAEQKPLLKPRVKEANNRYDQLLKMLRTSDKTSRPPLAD